MNVIPLTEEFKNAVKQIVDGRIRLVFGQEEEEDTMSRKASTAVAIVKESALKANTKAASGFSVGQKVVLKVGKGLVNAKVLQIDSKSGVLTLLKDNGDEVTRQAAKVSAAA